MAKNIIEFSAYSANTASYANYTSSKTVLGPDIRQFTGSVASEYWIGPNSTRFQDITQDTGLNNWGDLDAITYSGSKQWVFVLRGGATGLANAEIAAYEFDKNTYEYTYKGRTSFTPANNSAVVNQGIKANVEYYSSGSVTVNGTVVTGTGTDWIANRIPVGARIGFGSTSSADITTWYRIASYPSMSNKTGFTGAPQAIAVDSSGSLYVGGPFTAYSGSSPTRIVKLTPSGSIDTSFNSGAGFNAAVNVIRFDSSGSLWVGGDFTSYSGSTVNRIIKLNPNGTRDASFDTGSGFGGGSVIDIQFDSSGSLWVGGGFTTYKGVSTPYIAKILPDGTRDTTFVTSSANAPNTSVYTVAVDNADNVYIGGNFTQVGTVANNSRYIAKLLKTGPIDSTFVVGPAGSSNAFNGPVYALHYKSVSNSIVVGGAFGQWKGVNNVSLTELSAVGDVIITGPTATPSVQTFTPDSSGSLYVNFGINVQKVSLSTLRATNSTTQPTFNPNITYGNLNSFVYRPALSPSQNRLYIGSPNTTIDAGLVSVDTTYGDHDLNFHTTPDYASQVITLNTSAGTLSPGTPYVIENLQITLNKASQQTSLIQGIAWDDFTVAGTSIALPTADYAALNKGIYQILDYGYLGTTENDSYFNTAVTLGTTANDTRIIPKQSDDTQYVYVRNTTNRITRYNIKNSKLRIHGHAATAGLITFSTADQVLITGNTGVSGFGTGKATIATMQSGDASGSLSYYGDYSTGVIQIDLDSIQNQIVPTYTQMAEVPPGSTNTIPSAGNTGRVFYMSTIDKLIILNSSATAKSFITDYRVDLQQPTLSGTVYGRDTFNQLSIDNSYNLAFLGNFGQLQGNTANINAPRYPDTQGTGFYGTVENGVFHLCRPLATAQNNIYAVPLGCEAEFVDFSKNALYSPKYTLTNVVAISGLYANTLKQYGADPFILPPEPIFIYYRTTGIDDDSGEWKKYTTVDDLNADIVCEGVLENLEIQFRISYQVAGNTCLPNRVYGFTLVYEDDRTDSHYVPSVAKSDLTNRIFAWQQTESWYGNIPELKIRLYNAANNKIIYYDTTATNASGTWQYSTDGTTWLTWNATADAVGNYIRYVADFIPSGIKLRVGLNKI